MRDDPCFLLRKLGLSEKAISEIFPLCAFQEFREGEAIDFDRPAFYHAPFFVKSGLVSSIYKNSDSTSNILDIYGRNTLLGEAVFFGGSLASTYRCETAVSVLALPINQLVGALNQERAFANHLTKLSYWRYRHGECNRNDNKNKDAFLRVTFLLSNFIWAVSQGHCYEVEDKGSVINTKLAIPIKQSVLAHHFDVSRTIFSQCLQKLAVKGWLDLGYGYINFLNLASWKKIYFSHQKNEHFNLELSEHEGIHYA